MNLIFTDNGSLPANGTQHWRVCPWDQSTTHLPLGAKISLRAHVRQHGIASSHVRVHDLNEPTPAPFNPDQPMRNLDRDVADTVLMVDKEPVDLAQGVLVWQELGAVEEHNSPTVSISQDTGNRRVLVVSVENREPYPVEYTIELHVKVE